MGDHDDLPMCQKILRMGRLKKLDQPLEQLDAVIEEIMELIIQLVRVSSKEKLGRKEAAAATEWSRWEASDIYLGYRRISNNSEGKRMSRSS
jgi:hypothetical protein